MEVENKTIIEGLYKALAKGESQNVSKHLASDLEWWFHGPPHCQHMMRVLTGESAQSEFNFKPRTVTPIDLDRVIAEGWEGVQTQNQNQNQNENQAYWVHVWTIKDGLIVDFREYFNTWVTVRDLRPHNEWEIKNNDKLTIWQSHHPSQSMPGILLAI